MSLEEILHQKHRNFSLCHITSVTHLRKVVVMCHQCQTIPENGVIPMSKKSCSLFHYCYSPTWSAPACLPFNLKKSESERDCSMGFSKYVEWQKSVPWWNCSWHCARTLKKGKYLLYKHFDYCL